MVLRDETVAVIGAGAIGEALVRGMLDAKLISSDRIIAADVNQARLESLSRELGIRTTMSNLQAVKSARIVVLAVKPDVVRTVLEEVRDHLTGDHLVISIAAGVRISVIETMLQNKIPVVRVMPNTACLVGETAAGISAGSFAMKEHVKIALEIFESVGRAYEVEEKLIDAVTGLSGSGPAYVCTVIEGLADGGVASGLPREIATVLAAQTVLGTAKLVLESGIHPGKLREMVASPGGTTMEGLRVLEKNAVRSAFLEAVVAASSKAKALGKPPETSEDVPVTSQEVG